MANDQSNAGNRSLSGGRSAGGGWTLSGLIGRGIAALVTLTLLVVGLMFSLAFFAVALVVGAGVFGWMWWKMRRVLRQAREDPRFRAAGMDGQAGRAPGGDVIEGEVVHGEWKDAQGTPGIHSGRKSSPTTPP